MRNSTRKLKQIFAQNRNKSDAFYMEKYMNNKFVFFGLKAGLRRELTTPIIADNPIDARS